MRLDTVLDACEGRFVCDAWGIGDDWDADLLLRITRRLHGRAGAVRRESELPTAYEELVGGLLGTAVPELRIKLTPTPGTVIRQVKQVVPNEQELLATGDGFGERGAEYVTRAWGEEARHFQVVLTADPTGREIGEDLQLAAVDVVVPDFGRTGRSWSAGPTTRSTPHDSTPGSAVTSCTSRRAPPSPGPTGPGCAARTAGRRRTGNSPGRWRWPRNWATPPCWTHCAASRPRRARAVSATVSRTSTGST